MIKLINFNNSNKKMKFTIPPIFQGFICIILMIMAYRSWKPKIHYLSKSEQKYCICSVYLVGAPFAWITASMRSGLRSALLRCYQSPGFFDRGLRPVCIVGSCDQARLLANQIKCTVILCKPGIGTFGRVGRCQVLLENEIRISIMLVSRREHKVL